MSHLFAAASAAAAAVPVPLLQMECVFIPLSKREGERQEREMREND